jgi:signal transduction histidine kinase
MSVHDVPANPSHELTAWDRRYEQLVVAAPWILLILPTIISQLSRQSGADRAITLGLVGVAAGWVWFWHTRASRDLRARRDRMLVFFTGLLVLFAALMGRDEIFLLFTITGFFMAYLVRPWPFGVAAVFCTSVVLNTMTMGFPEDTSSVGVYVGVIAIQTAAIGTGVFFGEKGMEDHRQREAMVAKLEAALEENAGLHAQLLTQAREAGAMDERQRMAREIHDTLAQDLTGIITQTQAALRVWETPDHAHPHLERALGLAKDGLAEARRSVQALRPRELDEAQLPDALGDLAQRWMDDTDVGLHYDVTGERVALSPAIEVALFRVAQEALTNVSKHANASRVGLTLSYLGDVVLLDVRDDGTGMKNGRPNGFGLKSMQQRIKSIGGTVEIESRPGEGTAVSASVPAIVADAS